MSDCKTNIDQLCSSECINIQSEGKTRKWVFAITFEDICDYVNVHTVLDNKKDGEISVEHIYFDENLDYMKVIISHAIANISRVLARRMPTLPTIDEDGITFELTVGENHEDSMATVMYFKIMEYIDKFCYLEWNNNDTEVLRPLLWDIGSALHFRKHSLSHGRKVRNLL